MSEITGDRLKKVSEKLFEGNQSEMARMMGMSPQAMNKYFQGDRSPGFKVLKRLASIGININWILNGIPPMLISKMKGVGVEELFDADRIDPEKEENNQYKNKEEGSREEEPANPDFFAHINEENLTETESALLEEAKRFSRDLEKWKIPPQVKLLMLELMIEHIGQEIQRLHSNR